MTKKLARLLRADIQETSDLKSIAKMLANKGRGNDTLLAHITPREVKILKAAGGSGTVNPETGLMEFDDSFDVGGFEDLQAMAPVSDTRFPIQTEAPAEPEQPAMYQTQAPIEAQVQTEPVVPAVAEPVQQQIQGYGNLPPEYIQQQGIAAVPNVAAAPAVSDRGVPGFGAPIVARAGSAEPPPPPPPTLATRGGDILKALKAGGTDVLDFLKANPELVKLGTGGAGAVLTAQKAKEAAKQVQEATTQQKAIASPYQAQGAELQRAAMAGELTPQGAQAYQAMRAQLAQGVESRGGVGVAQAQAQLENTRQALLQQQADYGIKLSSIGDNIAIGAIRTGLQADQMVNQLTNSMYSNMFAIASGLSPQQIRTQATQGATP